MTWNLDIQNVAGIRSGTTRIEPGANAVRGSNWQGKSSLLTAIETVMGADSSLTEGENQGHVSLDADGDSWHVDLRRTGEGITREGEPYLTDEYDVVCANLFAFLGENNQIRRAVRNGENLEGLLTRPLDFENIDEQIADALRERDQIDVELERATDAARQLPGVEQEIADLEDQIETLEAERDEMTVDNEESAEIDDKREKLSDARAEYEQVENLVEQLENTIDHTRSKLEEHHGELEDLDVPDDADIEEKIADARDAFKEVERDAELLQSVYAANKRLLTEDRLHLLTEVEPGLLDDEITCWTCGSQAEREQFSDRLELLGETVMEYREELSERQDKVEELTARRDEIRRKQRHKSDLETEVTSLETTIEDRQESLQSARNRLEELESRVEDLSQDIETIDDQLTEVESELKYTRAQLNDAHERREELETQAEKRELLEREREDVTEEITRLRSRKSEIKARTREAFDDAIDEIMTQFDTGFETARLTQQFDLVVARDGRSASLDALSEGERELLAIVAALAGHEAFEVADRVPVLLLDALGGLADENVHKLVDYVEERAPYLVFTAYPEYETFDGHEIVPQDWQVVSQEVPEETDLAA